MSSSASNSNLVPLLRCTTKPRGDCHTHFEIVHAPDGGVQQRCKYCQTYCLKLATGRRTGNPSRLKIHLATCIAAPPLSFPSTSTPTATNTTGKKKAKQTNDLQNKTDAGARIALMNGGSSCSSSNENQYGESSVMHETNEESNLMLFSSNGNCDHHEHKQLSATVQASGSVIQHQHPQQQPTTQASMNRAQSQQQQLMRQASKSNEQHQYVQHAGTQASTKNTQSQQQQHSTTSRSRSVIHSHFDMVTAPNKGGNGKQQQCKYCRTWGLVIPKGRQCGNAKRLKDHFDGCLARKHAFGIVDQSGVTSFTPIQARERLNEIHRFHHMSNDKTDDSDGMMISSSVHANQVGLSAKEKSAFTDTCVEMMLSEDVHVNHFERESVQRMFRVIRPGMRADIFPSRKSVVQTYLPQFVKKTRESMRHALKESWTACVTLVRLTDQKIRPRDEGLDISNVDNNRYENNDGNNNNDRSNDNTNNSNSKNNNSNDNDNNNNNNSINTSVTQSTTKHHAFIGWPLPFHVSSEDVPNCVPLSNTQPATLDAPVTAAKTSQSVDEWIKVQLRQAYSNEKDSQIATANHNNDDSSSSSNGNNSNKININNNNNNNNNMTAPRIVGVLFDHMPVDSPTTGTIGGDRNRGRDTTCPSSRSCETGAPGSLRVERGDEAEYNDAAVFDNIFIVSYSCAASALVKHADHVLSLGLMPELLKCATTISNEVLNDNETAKLLKAKRVELHGSLYSVEKRERKARDRASTNIQHKETDQDRLYDKLFLVESLVRCKTELQALIQQGSNLLMRTTMDSEYEQRKDKDNNNDNGDEGVRGNNDNRQNQNDNDKRKVPSLSISDNDNVRSSGEHVNVRENLRLNSSEDGGTGVTPSMLFETSMRDLILDDSNVFWPAIQFVLKLLRSLSFVQHVLQSDTTPISMVPACFIMLHRFYDSLSSSSSSVIRSVGLTLANFQAEGHFRESLRRSWHTVTNPDTTVSNIDIGVTDSNLNDPITQDGNMSLLMHLALSLDPCTWGLLEVCASTSIRLGVEYSVPQSAQLGAKLLMEQNVVQERLQRALAGHVVWVRARGKASSQIWRGSEDQRCDPLGFWAIQDSADMQLLPLANIVFRLISSAMAVRRIHVATTTSARESELLSTCMRDRKKVDESIKAAFNRVQLRRYAENCRGVRSVEMLEMVLGSDGANSFSLLSESQRQQDVQGEEEEEEEEEQEQQQQQQQDQEPELMVNREQPQQMTEFNAAAAADAGTSASAGTGSVVGVGGVGIGMGNNVADDDDDGGYVNVCVLCNDNSRRVPRHHCQMCQARVHGACCQKLTGVEDTLTCGSCWRKRRKTG